MIQTLGLSALALVVGLASGSYYTAKYKEANHAAAMAQAARRAADKEAVARDNIADISRGYNDRISGLNAVIDSTNAELGRLRVKRCAAVPTVATTTGRADAGAGDNTDGDREVEVDLDGVAREVIRLGADLDKANEQIRGLQATVKSYLTAAGGH
jgi:hypothetical protein